MLLKLPLCFLIILMSGLMLALFLIGLLVCLLLELGSLLISLLLVGIIGVGAMLIRLVPLVVSSVAGVFLLFLDLSSLFNVLSSGVLFLLYSPLVLSILVLIIWVVFVMLAGCLMVAVALCLLSSSKDGDLLVLIERMLHLRGLTTVRISKVKGHADEVMVLQGRVREVDRIGNDAADEAADFGRGRVGHLVIDARRNLSKGCGRRYPVLLDLHRFFIAISRAVVNHDDRDGTALDLLVWSAGALPKRRRLVHAVRDWAFCLGRLVFWDSAWVNVPASAICAEDISHWPYTPGLLVKWVAFLGTLHWPAGGVDLGVGGFSYVELLILCELWAGERLSLEKAHPRYLRPGRPISVSAVPFGPGLDILAFLSFHWCFNEVSLFAAWWYWSVCALLCWC